MNDNSNIKSLAEVADELKEQYEEPCAALVPLLFEVQQREGRISIDSETEVSELLAIDSKQVHEAVTFYPLLSNDALGHTLIQVCHNISCSLLGIEPLIEFLQEQLEIKAGEVTPDGKIGLRRAECLGCCSDAPVMLVGEKLVGNLTKEKIQQVISDLREGKKISVETEMTNTNEIENPALSVNFSVPNATSIKTAESRGAYQIARKALNEMKPIEILEEVKSSGLRGQGGAGFPAGLKWSFVPQVENQQKYLCVNGDESEPGTCKDREILRRDPHRLIEGIILASRAIGVSKAYIYIRREFYEPTEIMNKAIQEAYQAGYLGKNIFGIDMNLDLFTHPGAGAYICGEETGLLNSLEGKKGWPRIKPPFPAVKGLFQKPTVVNNIETIANVPFIIKNGATVYRSRGTERSPGTKLFGVSGHVKKPGMYELPMGTPLREIIFGAAEGIREGHALKAVIPGGSSVPILRAEEIDVDMDFESTEAAGTMLGSGAVIVMDETCSMPEVLEILSRFYAHESCGQCTPCREGTPWMYKILHRINNGLGRKGDLETLLDIADNIDGTTVCPLAPAAAWPVQSMLKKFRDEFEQLLY